MTNPNRLIGRIRSVLSPNLIKSDQRTHALIASHPVAGHCYVFAEVLYHMWGCLWGFEPHRVTVTVGHRKISHWYLQKGVVIIDPTREQFKVEVPYDQGTKTAFLTKKRKLSRRAQEVIRRLEVKL